MNVLVFGATDPPLPPTPAARTPPVQPAGTPALQRGVQLARSPAGGQPMSRVEPKDERRDVPQEATPEPRRLSDRKPEKAEGDERTIEEALKNQEQN